MLGSIRTTGLGNSSASANISLSAEDRILVLAVHPDDESLCAGGLIQEALKHKASLQVIFVTDGDDNPWAQRFVEARWHIGQNDRVRWGERRRGEALAALAALGVPKACVEFWGFRDQGMTALLMDGGEEFVVQLAELVRVWRPSMIVGPSMDDLHPDHNSVAVLVDSALATIEPPVPRPRVLEYLVHRAATKPESSMIHVGLSPDQLATKRRAILIHRTQMALSRRRFTAFARPMEMFLERAAPAEGRMCDETVKADVAGESVALAADCFRRPSTILILARGAGVQVARIVKIPLFGNVLVRDAGSGAILDEAPVLTGGVLTLPAAPFASAAVIAVKRIGRLGIFDESGWQQVEVGPRALAEEASVALRPRVCCIIPCFNVAGQCGAVVNDAALYADMVIAIDDGSTDETGICLQRVADRHPGKVTVLRFSTNMGKGVVMIAAIRRALATLEFDVLVTLDGDGQHRPQDIPRLAQELVRGKHALVIGERLALSKMPLRSRLGNALTAFIMHAFHPSCPTDTQSGLRAFRPDFLRDVAQRIEGGRYETELKILLLALKRGYRIGSVTIPTVYIDGNRLSHFRPFSDSLRIYWTLFSWTPADSIEREPAIAMDTRSRAGP